MHTIPGTMFLDAPKPVVAQRSLTEDDAVDVWLARWLRIRPKDLIRRYGCDPRRLYEVWEGSRFPEARERALGLLRERYPDLESRIDPGNHRRFSREADARQLDLFS